MVRKSFGALFRARRPWLTLLRIASKLCPLTIVKPPDRRAYALTRGAAPAVSVVSRTARVYFPCEFGYKSILPLVRVSPMTRCNSSFPLEHVV